MKKFLKRLKTNFQILTSEKFINFRDNILLHFKNYKILSIDGVDIKWDLWNEHFMEYYTEVIIYIDNR